MKIIFYTSGTTGTGRLVRGFAIFNALKRTGIKYDFTIISSSPFAYLADFLGINHITVQPETEKELGKTGYKKSKLYNTIESLDPDILIVDLLWFPLYQFIDGIECKKIFLSRQVSDSFYKIPRKDHILEFNSNQYDKLISIEPFKSFIDFELINPIVLRNKTEIYDKETALEKLSIVTNKPVCFLAYNGHPGDFEKVQKTYSYLEDEGYNMVYSTNYNGGIFPVLDYFNALDLIICGAGYNAFWETVFFDKEAILVPTYARFEDPSIRIENGKNYNFKENGADQLVEIILNL